MVALGVCFELVSSTFYVLFAVSVSLPPGARIMRCAQECLLSSICGGFVWRENETPSCQHVVPSTVAGVTTIASQTSVYRRAEFRGRRIITLQLPGIGYSWQGATEACEALKGKLIDYPQTDQEKVTFTILATTAAYVDLNNALTDAYINKFGVAARMDNIVWDGGNPAGGLELCVGVRGNPLKYFDWRCSQIIDPNYATVFCIDE